MTNPYCKVLGIDVPVLDEVKGHREARPYSMLMVALLERGAGMTLDEVAHRFAEAGFAPADAALRSLRRCRPARAPVHRDGDLYVLDPHDDELGLWVFRLGLRPPHAPRLRLVRPEPEPLAGPAEPLTVAELEEAWSDAHLGNWSAQRVALAVLDAHGRPMTPTEVVGFADARCRGHPLSTDSAHHWRRGAAIHAGVDGRWGLDPGHAALASARRAVRERVAVVRRHAAVRPDPSVVAGQRQAAERRRTAKGEELARLRRVLVHAFPPQTPQAVVLLDVARRELATFLGDELERIPEQLTAFDVIGALAVRPLLRALEFEVGERRLADLGPPQKTMRLNKQGRTLKITTPMLIRGSCNIARPLGDPKQLREYLRTGATTPLRRRLEADARSLYALYQYGRLHGAVRLQWGFLDELLPVPWVQWDEERQRLYYMLREAHERGQMLEVILGSAPGWKDPWARSKRCWPDSTSRRYGLDLVGEDGALIDERLVQSARLVSPDAPRSAPSG